MTWAFEYLKARQILYLERSGANYPVAWCHIAEEWMSEVCLLVEYRIENDKCLGIVKLGR
jgi:hypothetical protein